MANQLKIIFILLLVVSGWSSVNAQETFHGPGGCTNKEECRAYCNEDSHKEECLTFGVQNGLMTQEEADRARKFLNQTGPGGCRGEECKSYCEYKLHREECLKFTEENGLISGEEAARARKFQKIEVEGGPGGCKGEECRTYCEDEAHREECFKFAKENGLIGEEEIKQFETGLKIREKIKESGGPGGCKSEEECHSYCSDVSHVEECVKFGAAHTDKSEAEIEQMLRDFKDMKGHMQERKMRGEGFDGPEFRSDFGDGEFEDGEFQENFHMVPPGERNGRFPQRPPTTEEMERMKEKYRQNYEQYREQMPSENQMMPGSMPQEGQMFPEDYQNQGTYPKPESYQQYEGSYQQYPQDYQPQQYQTAPTTPEPTFAPTTFESALPPPPSEPAPQPTSYNHSKSFLANVLSAFLAPFRK